jgi:Cu2+-exporting ATPase
VADGTALERLASADHVVLDKTGTMTEGRPTLLPGDWTDAQLRAAAGLARASRHPLARALAAACPGAPARNAGGVREVPGRGLDAGNARLGGADFLGLAVPDAGLTLWFKERSAEPVAFRFADRLRPDAPATLDRLRGLGLTVELLSGDAPPAVAEAAQRTGIRDWTARARPEDKAARIEALRAAGRRPLMVGDGNNDAAALALAHVSACPAGGTDLAQTAADLVLRREELAALPVAIATARRAQRLMRQNIGFSLAYNAVAVPLAVAGLATPLVAALIMASSSLAVTLNALRAGKD